MSYPEPVNIAKALQTMLQTISYVQKVTIAEDLDKLIRDKKAPFIDIEVPDFSTGQADNQRPVDYDRRSFNVLIRFCVINKDKAKVFQGVHTTVGQTHTISFYGIWDLYSDIKSTLDGDLTISDTVDAVPLKPEVATDSVLFEDGVFWVGRGVMSFKVSKDYYVGQH